MKTRESLISVGMLLSIIGMLFFDAQPWLKYCFLIGAIVVILFGLGIEKSRSSK